MLYQKLLELKESGELVAFVKWADGDGMLVGIVRNVTPEEVAFDLIDPLGHVHDENSVVPMESIYELRDSPAYFRRLKMFGTLSKPDVKTKGSITKSQKEIARRLRVAVNTQECVGIRTRGDYEQDSRILGVDSKYCECITYRDDPLVEEERLILRLEHIEHVRWRSSNMAAVTEIWRRSGIIPVAKN